MPDATQFERALILADDLAALTPDERVDYYKAVCESAGLNPVTKPFTYLTLDGKFVLYATRACTDQLRKLHGISVIEMTKEVTPGLVYVVIKIADKTGRTDVAGGAVSIEGLKGDAVANAYMKAETKAKRRATLSICGLGMLDESELETIPPIAFITPPNTPVAIPQATTAPAVNQAAAPPEPIVAAIPQPLVKNVPAPTKPPQIPPPAVKTPPVPMSAPPVPQTTPPAIQPAPVPPPVPANPVPAQVIPAVQPAIIPASQPAPVAEKGTVVPNLATPPPVSTAPAPTGEDAPATAAEYQVFIGQRSAKIVRDKLAPAGVKQPGDVMKAYLLKQSGKPQLKQISAATFERLVGELEKATPADAVKLVTEGTK